MSAPGTQSSAPQSSGAILSTKVPLVTLYFWIIKIMATTVGETAADFLNFDMKLGLVKTRSEERRVGKECW